MNNFDIQLFVYDTPSEILNIFLEDQEDKSTVPIIDEEDGEHEVITRNAMLKRLKRRKCWGFCEGDQVHIWFDPSVDMEDLVHLIGHERGHTLRPFHKDDIKEERKAEMFGTNSRFAYRAAKHLMDNYSRR